MAKQHFTSDTNFYTLHSLSGSPFAAIARRDSLTESEVFKSLASV